MIPVKQSLVFNHCRSERRLVLVVWGLTPRGTTWLNLALKLPVKAVLVLPNKLLGMALKALPLVKQVRLLGYSLLEKRKH
jgi:hypothetical protein